MNNYLNTTSQNIGWFHKAHISGELDMSPPFQRKPVWVTKQKSFLIDTILHGFPIPEIYMQETVDAKGESKHIAVDGQQRIRSVLEFIASEFVMDPSDSPKFADMQFEDLSVGQKKAIFQYKFVIRSLPDIPETDLREVFRRINTNVVALNSQELRQAIYWGPFIETMNEISDQLVWGQIGLFTPNDIRRMLDVEYVSELVVGLLHGYQNKKTTLDKYYQLYEEEFDEQEFVVETLDSVVGEILQILPDIRKTRWSKKSDFYTLFLVFAEHRRSLPLTALARGAAREMLEKFANSIDEIGKSQESAKAKYPQNVRNYSKAVIRAASDLGSRKSRAVALEEELGRIWES
ncbi:MAG: DUF262 domain-containing protein [Acidobacteriota bacterium]